MRIQERNLIKIHRNLNEGCRKMHRRKLIDGAFIDIGKYIPGFFLPENNGQANATYEERAIQKELEQLNEAQQELNKVKNMQIEKPLQWRHFVASQGGTETVEQKINELQHQIDRQRANLLNAQS